jgi:hypothetical protein
MLVPQAGDAPRVPQNPSGGKGHALESRARRAPSGGVGGHRAARIAGACGGTVSHRDGMGSRRCRELVHPALSHGDDPLSAGPRAYLFATQGTTSCRNAKAAGGRQWLAVGDQLSVNGEGGGDGGMQAGSMRPQGGERRTAKAAGYGNPALQQGRTATARDQNGKGGGPGTARPTARADGDGARPERQRRRARDGPPYRNGGRRRPETRTAKAAGQGRPALQQGRTATARGQRQRRRGMATPPYNGGRRRSGHAGGGRSEHPRFSRATVPPQPGYSATAAASPARDLILGAAALTEAVDKCISNDAYAWEACRA